jgi:hypothetical protein
VEQDSRINASKFNGNKPTQETIEGLASTAELLLPKKRTKVKELSTVTIAHMKNKRPDQAGDYRIGGFLLVQGFHVRAQLGKTYPLQEELQISCR